MIELGIATITMIIVSRGNDEETGAVEGLGLVVFVEKVLRGVGEVTIEGFGDVVGNPGMEGFTVVGVVEFSEGLGVTVIVGCCDV
jgi:hypothetical protein